MKLDLSALESDIGVPNSGEPSEAVPPRQQLEPVVVAVHAASSAVLGGVDDALASEASAFPVEDTELALSFEEAIRLGAVNSIVFNSLWFPKTFRQAPALFHPDMYAILDDPSQRYINMQVCRDGAKTTILRAYSAKRIAYGLSRTILYIAVNETKAIQSLMWLKHQIETNKSFCTAFGLSVGKPWTDVHICIQRTIKSVVTGEVEVIKVHVIAYGITSGVRGVNLEDYRPDLIIVDDVMDDDNSSTSEQRDKIKTRVLGAIKESLSPRSETPDAKLVLLNTPQDFDDLSEDAKKDRQFSSTYYGCWTKETEDLPVEEQESSWPDRYPSNELRSEKLAAMARGKYAIFAKEKECKLIVPEQCAFRVEHLNYFGPGEKMPEPPKHDMHIVIAIDPVPPPTKKQLDEGLKKKDYESFAVLGRWQGDYYALENVYNRGHDPLWTATMFFELCVRWSPRVVLVESVAYQATLAWLLRQAMMKAGRYWPIEEFKDKRQKYKRIVDGLSGPISEGHFYVRRTQSTLIGQIQHYPGKNPAGTFDDVIESFAVAALKLQHGYVGDVPEDHYKAQEAQYEELEYGGAP